MGILEFVVTIVAMALGAITFWIILLRNNKQATRIEPEGNYDMNQLSRMADSMQQRIEFLESILDAEVPDWREQNDRTPG